MRKFFLFFIGTLGLFAQTPAPPAPATSNVSQYIPQYFVGTGVAFDYYGKTGFAAQTEFAANGCFLTNTCDKGLSKVFSFTTIELTAQQATMRTGAAYIFLNQGNWYLIGLGDAGLATGSGPTLGSFSGGGFIGYDIGSKISKGASHFLIAFGGRVIAITSQAVQPVPSFILGKVF